ncbi:restriction endonuclease subunit S [Aliarcobacter cryaerophilus]|uniref:restriction endonuclease subunit S n=1 Tax=Aliarcobacter cryaerophilus TaxID=28198 RepID=UPI00317F6C10
MSDKMKNIPKLRFPEFLNEPKWQKIKLNKLGKLVSGLTYSPDDIREDGLLVLRSSNVQDGEIKLEDNVYVRTDIKGANLSKPNDILICVRNGSKALIGKNALIPDNMPLCTHGAFMTVFRAELPKFVFQLFQTKDYERQVNADLGATINSINGNKFIKYEFYVPTNEKEQNKIADCLSSLDSLIITQSQKVEFLKEHKKGLLQNLFPKDGESVSKYRFPEFINDGELEEKQLDDIIKSYSSSIALNKLQLKGKGYPVYGADTIVGYIDEFQHEKEYISIVKDGSGVGRLNFCQSQSSILGTLTCLKSKNETLYDLKWIYYLLNTIDFSTYIKGAGIPHIYYSDYKNENILVPKIKEQKKIADFLTSIDEKINLQIRKVESLKEHKKALLQQLFTSNEVNK